MSQEMRKKLLALVLFLLASFSFTGCGVWRNFTTYFNTYYNAKTLFDQTEEQIKLQKKDIFAFRDDQQNTLSASDQLLSGFGTNPNLTGLNNRFQSGNQNNQFGNQNNQFGNQNNQFGNQNNQFGNQNNQFGNQNNQFGNQNNQFGNQNNQFGNQNNQFGNQNNQFGNQNNQFGNQNNQFGNQNNQFGSQPTALFSGNTQNDLTKVIEKCSKVLQYEKESAYFPDALFIIGKAFYYQHEYSKAQRKFIELAGLGETDYSLETNLWLAKTYLQLRSFDEGIALLDEVKKRALEEDEEEIFVAASITKISFYLYRFDYTNAIEECKKYLEVSTDDENNALVAFQMGKTYLELGEKENALKYFSSVLSYKPKIEIELQSRIQYAKLLKSLNRDQESEDELTTLSDQGKFRNFLDIIYLELGEIKVEKKEIETAIRLYKDIDTTFRQNPSSGIASYKLGNLYKEHLADYDSSYKYYHKSIQSLAPRDFKDEAQKNITNLDKYFTLKNEYKLNVKSRLYITDPTLFVKDSVDFALANREIEEERRKLAESQAQSQSMQNTEQRQMSPEEVLKFQKEQLYIAELQRRQNISEEELKKIPLKILITINKVKKPEKPNISVDSISALIAQNYFDLGSLFFSELDHADSAFYFFNKVITDYPDKKAHVNALYSLGTYYETQNDSVKADSIFKHIYDTYPGNSLATASGIKLGLIKKEEKAVAALSSSKTIDEAEEPYIRAEKLYFDKNYKEAIDSFKIVYKKFPKSKYAPKAVYYYGLIFEENLKEYDSAAVAYSILLEEFSKEEVSRLAIAKYGEYKLEKDKIKAAEELKKKELENKNKLELEKQNAINNIVPTEISKPVKPDSVKIEKDDEIMIKQMLLKKKAEADSIKKNLER